jgi:CcmD family protein
MKKFVFSVLSLALSFFVSAQDSTVLAGVKPATGLRSDGKIYVVMVVALTILAGLFIYLINLDRKISKLEKKSH